MEKGQCDDLDPMISRSLNKDYCKIIINFLNNQNKDLSFLNFKAYWKSMNFTLLHYLTLDKYNYSSYIQIIFHTILKLLSCQYYNYIDHYKKILVSDVNENCIREALWNMCVLYILYISYYTQISSENNMIQIQISPEYASCLLNASMSMNQIHSYGLTAKKLYSILITNNCFVYKSYSGTTSLLYCYLHLNNFEQRQEQFLNIASHDDNEIPSTDHHIDTTNSTYYNSNVQKYLDPSKCYNFYVAKFWNVQNVLLTKETIHRILQEMLLLNQNFNSNDAIEKESTNVDIVTIPNPKENEVDISMILGSNIVHNENVPVNHLFESISYRRQEYTKRKSNRIEQMKNLENIRQNKIKTKINRIPNLQKRKLKKESLYTMEDNRILVNKDNDVEAKQVKKTRQLYTTSQLEQIALMKPLCKETTNNVDTISVALECSNDHINEFLENSTSLYSDFEEFVGIKNTNTTAYTNPIYVLNQDLHDHSNDGIIVDIPNIPNKLESEGFEKFDSENTVIQNKTNSKRKSKHNTINNKVADHILNQVESNHIIATTNIDNTSSLELLDLLESLERSSSSILKEKK